MRLRTWITFGVLIASGCTGRVLEPEPSSFAPPPVGNGSPNGQDNNPDVDRCLGVARDPGRVTIHRLNRAEYNNTTRDLIGLDLRPAEDFPPDDHGYGFDNIADVLAVAPLLVEKYQLAAETLVAEALRKPGSGGPTTQRFEAEVLSGTAGNAYADFGWNLYSTGSVTATFRVDVAGEYLVSARVFGQQAGPDPARVRLSVDGQSLGVFDVPETEANPGTRSARTTLAAGSHTLQAAFTNDYYEPPADRNLIVDWLAVEGPMGVTAPPSNPEVYARIMVCDPIAMGEDACAREILDRFARRAWRRPLDAAELDRLFALYSIPVTEGDGFEKGIELALQAVLLSPNFLFRVERDPDPTSLEPHPLGQFELASRLSYFLWSSMPDDALFAAAERRALHEESVIRGQITRMLADQKAQALVDNFAGQWLLIRALDDVSPDYAVYPTWDEELRAAMREEARLVFETFVKEPKHVLDMLDASFTFLNDRLAEHYGLPPPGSSELVRVNLGSDDRGGILSQGSILTVTSRPKRTSPVKRGKWMLEQILCQAPPPPPPGVEGLIETSTAGSVRDRLEAHRTSPTCRACHETMDNLGFALEHYDGVGAWRDMDGDFAVNSSGVLPDGRSFDGARQLGAVLKEDRRTAPCVTRRLMTYALGRGVEYEDECSVQDVTAKALENGFTFEALMTSIATHPTFTSRRGETP